MNIFKFYKNNNKNGKLHIISTCSFYKNKRNYTVMYYTLEEFYSLDDSLVCKKCKKRLNKILKKEYFTSMY